MIGAPWISERKEDGSFDEEVGVGSPGASAIIGGYVLDRGRAVMRRRRCCWRRVGDAIRIESFKAQVLETRCNDEDKRTRRQHNYGVTPFRIDILGLRHFGGQ